MKGETMTVLQIITTTRAAIEYGPEFAVEGSIEDNLDELIDKLLEEKPEQLINDINQKGTEND